MVCKYFFYHRSVRRASGDTPQVRYNSSKVPFVGCASRDNRQRCNKWGLAGCAGQRGYVTSILQNGFPTGLGPIEEIMHKAFIDLKTRKLWLTVLPHDL